MMKQEQNVSELDADAYVSISTGLRASIRYGFKMRSSALMRQYLKKDIATLRLVRNSVLLVKKIG